MNEALLQKHVSDVPIIALDLETTGFSPRTGDEIIEIGAMKILDGKIIDEFQSLINPFRPINPRASAVNGITNDMVANAPSIEDIFSDFLNFIGDSPLIIHNAGFDLPFIAWKTSELGYEPRCNIVFDTLLLSRALNPHFANHKLSNVVIELGLGIDPSHRALVDSFAAWLVFKTFLSSMGNGHPITVGKVLRIQGGTFNWPVANIIAPEQMTDTEKAIQRAIDENTSLLIEYFSPYSNSTTSREIRPQQLVRRSGRSYVVADCLLRNEQRTFRVDRIQKM